MQVATSYERMEVCGKAQLRSVDQESQRLAVLEFIAIRESSLCALLTLHAGSNCFLMISRMHYPA